ncbi:MAG: zinc-ribbon domain-containing protein [Neisseriaceae bacterium]|nr:zinc-ribbon domain-containing protein [Neisseriaceae bacterium]
MLITTCPVCQAKFRVSEQHLSAADGLVVCSRCHNIFQAKDSLQNLSKPATTTPNKPVSKTFGSNIRSGRGGSVDVEEKETTQANENNKTSEKKKDKKPSFFSRMFGANSDAENKKDKQVPNKKATDEVANKQQTDSKKTVQKTATEKTASAITSPVNEKKVSEKPVASKNNIQDKKEVSKATTSDKKSAGKQEKTEQVKKNKSFLAWLFSSDDGKKTSASADKKADDKSNSASQKNNAKPTDGKNIQQSAGKQIQENKIPEKPQTPKEENDEEFAIVLEPKPRGETLSLEHKPESATINMGETHISMDHSHLTGDSVGYNAQNVANMSNQNVAGQNLPANFGNMPPPPAGYNGNYWQPNPYQQQPPTPHHNEINWTIATLVALIVLVIQLFYIILQK